jgi:hypothetical protein
MLTAYKNQIKKSRAKKKHNEEKIDKRETEMITNTIEKYE